MNSFNDIGISKKLDFPRIKKLLSIGVFASIMHLIADFILGWGVKDESKKGLLKMISAYTKTSDKGIFIAAILGLFGMVLEGLSLFGIYRLMAEKSEKCAHNYRSGILGYLMFGACGFHVPMCGLTFLIKHDVDPTLVVKYSKYFILPAIILFTIFFLILSITQIIAFLKEYTPYPKCAWIFSMPIGMLIALVIGVTGNHPFMNAMFCAWIAFGSLWMFGGLLLMLRKVQIK